MLTKQAGIPLTKALARMLGPYVRVNAIRPGLVDTELVGFVTAGGPVLEDYLACMPISRVGTPDDIAQVAAFAHDHGLTVSGSHRGQRTVKLTGPVEAFNAAFGTTLQIYRSKNGTYRGRTGSLTIPAALADVIVGVHGLDNRPVASPHFRVSAPVTAAGARGRTRSRGKQPRPGRTRGPAPRNAADGSLSVVDIARLYNFPSGLTGAGQCIALIELNDLDANGKVTGTGYKSSDIVAFFQKLGLPVPQVVSVGVDGGVNLPGHSDADGEVVLDIEVAGGAAPGATIAVYFAPNTTQGFIDAIKAAAHDATLKPSVISISWGGPEDEGGQVPQQFIVGMNEAMQEAAAMGVTVLCAAGDSGSADVARAGWDGKPHADFPASSQLAIACGGTKLTGSTGATPTIQSEVVWNEGSRGGAGGGGVSTVMPLPSWQSKSKVPKNPKGRTGRGVPDVAGNADPKTGYQIVLDAKSQVFGGTSAVAPLFAALFARINQRLASAASGKAAGYVNPLLYGTAATAFRDITSGNNDVYGTLRGKYTAGKGWDACTGLGVVRRGQTPHRRAADRCSQVVDEQIAGERQQQQVAVGREFVIDDACERGGALPFAPRFFLW